MEGGTARLPVPAGGLGVVRGACSGSRRDTRRTTTTRTAPNNPEQVARRERIGEVRLEASFGARLRLRGSRAAAHGRPRGRIRARRGRPNARARRSDGSEDDATRARTRVSARIDALSSARRVPRAREGAVPRRTRPDRRNARDDATVDGFYEYRFDSNTRAVSIKQEYSGPGSSTRDANRSRASSFSDSFAYRRSSLTSSFVPSRASPNLRRPRRPRTRWSTTAHVPFPFPSRDARHAWQTPRGPPFAEFATETPGSARERASTPPLAISRAPPHRFQNHPRPLRSPLRPPRGHAEPREFVPGVSKLVAKRAPSSERTREFSGIFGATTPTTLRARAPTRAWRGLGRVRRVWRETRDERRARVSAQRLLKQPREFTVAVGSVRMWGLARGTNLRKTRGRLRVRFAPPPRLSFRLLFSALPPL